MAQARKTTKVKTEKQEAAPVVVVDESKVTWLPKNKAHANSTVEVLGETRVEGGVEFVKCVYK